MNNLRFGRVPVGNADASEVPVCACTNLYEHVQEGAVRKFLFAGDTRILAGCCPLLTDCYAPDRVGIVLFHTIHE
jgi:hypothetical protein